MNLQKKISEINNRWKIDDGYSEEKEFQKFKTRIMNSFSDIDNHVTNKSIADFCNVLGIKEVWHDADFIGHKWSANITNSLIEENDSKKFYRLLEIIFALDIRGTVGHDGRYTYNKEILYDKVEEAISFSKVNVRITKTENDIILYPSGEKILDKELVNKTLTFLDDKPESHFIDALKSFGQNSPRSRIKSIDSLRRCLEEFFRLLLNNNKGLTVNIKEISNILKMKKANNDIRNHIVNTITYLDNPIFNNNSKHRDGDISESENELMIYQVALVMRYLDRAING